MDKGVLNTHYGILLNHKKEQNNAICSHVDGPRYHHIKSEKQIPYGITHMWNLKTGHKYIYKTETDSDTENRLVTKAGVWGREGLRV